MSYLDGPRLVFTGRVPYGELPAYLRLMDVALSTQTNNLPGQVRTTYFASTQQAPTTRGPPWEPMTAPM